MKIPGYLFLVILSGVLFSCQSTEKKTETDPDSGQVTTYLVDSKTGLKSGPYEKKDGAGVLLETGFFKEDKPYGIRQFYYPDGTVKIRERYRNGRIDDLYEYFHPNGRIELMGHYVHGEMYGIWKKYDDQGNLLERVTMIRNEENGPFVEFYPNGKIQAEGAYLHGPNEDGELRLYDESGVLFKTMLCNAGRCYTSWQRL